IYLSCNHPVTGKLTSSFLNVHKDELLPSVLDKAYELMELAPHIPIERCRLVKYNIKDKVMNQPFDLDEYQTIGQIAGGARVRSSFKLFLETCKENETFKKYSHGVINLEVSLVDLSSVEVGLAKPVRGEESWTVEELKQHIGELFNISSSCMRVVMKEKDYQGNLTQDISHVRSTLKNILSKGYRQYEKTHTDTLFSQFYVSSDPEDYQKDYKRSLMYRYVEFYVKWIIQLNITISLKPEATPTTTNVTEGGMMKIISINEENDKEKRIQVQVDKRITLAQLKEELVPLIGVPPTGFRVYEIIGNEEYEMEELDMILKDIESGSKLIVRLGRALRRGEYRIKLYLLQVNKIRFCKFMMESIVAMDTPVREFKKQIIEEAKKQGIDCVLELDKMRLREKNRLSPGTVYPDHERIYNARSPRIDDINKEIHVYVEPLKGPEKKKHTGQRQLYVIRWRPSQCSVDPIEEIILDSLFNPKHVIEKLSELSGVPAKYIYYTEGESFSVEISCLDIEYKLRWYSITNLYRYSLGLYYEGRVIYYKDKRERMKKLTDKERSEIQEAEEARLNRIKEIKALYSIDKDIDYD
uniref:Ubiquitin-like domain-containing protein n=1 Tax=Amphimedon queenslandica TaxID=400682 RepID=A0A1X7TBR6_AMPQE